MCRRHHRVGRLIFETRRIPEADFFCENPFPDPVRGGNPAALSRDVLLNVPDGNEWEFSAF